ncbi:MAG: hypothetical protein R2838_13860 [Caldilineaceae bacterium]
MLAIGANQQRADARSTPDGSPVSALMAGATRHPRPASAPRPRQIALATACRPTPVGLAARLPMDYYDEAIRAYSEFSGVNAWAMLGTLALGEPVPT